jgi:hypothetical protein
VKGILCPAVPLFFENSVPGPGPSCPTITRAPEDHFTYTLDKTHQHCHCAGGLTARVSQEKLAGVVSAREDQKIVCWRETYLHRLCMSALQGWDASRDGCVSRTLWVVWRADLSMMPL